MARRSVAVAATTALFAGLGGGVLATAAYAAPGDAPVVSTISPNVWDNRSKVTVTVTGQNFSPLNNDQTGNFKDTVILRPAFQGPEVGDLSTSATGAANNTTSLTATFDLSMASPGLYRLIVQSGIGGGPSATPVNPNFSIFSYGPAHASGVAVGVSHDGIDPFGVDCNVDVTVEGCGRGPRALDISGSNIAIGASVRFLKGDGTPDTLTFAPGNVENAKNIQKTHDDTGYPSTSLLQGNYSYPDPGTHLATPGFTPGFHDLQIVNTDVTTTGTTTKFAQPWFPSNGLSPVTIGAGSGQNDAPAKVLTITGQGIRAGSRLDVESRSPSNSCTGDISVGPATLDGYDAATDTYTVISAPVSVKNCADLGNGARWVEVRGPDGGRYMRSGLLTLSPAPVLTSVQAGYRILGQGAHVGFGNPDCSNAITIQGTGFVSDAGNDPTKMTRFTFGPGVTVTTCRVGTSSSAQVSIDVLAAPDAATGDRVATAINPDGGSKQTARPTVNGQPDPTASAPLAIAVGPRIDTVSPASFPNTTAINQGVTVTGSGFTNNSSSTAAPLVTITPPGIGVEPGSVSVVDAQHLTFSAFTSDATPGPRDLIVEKADDHGRAMCVGCVGVDSLVVTKVNGTTPPAGQPAQAPNDATSNAVLTLQSRPLGAVTGAGSAVPGGTVVLTHIGSPPPPGQGPIAGTNLTKVDGDTITAEFSLLHVAPGFYSVKVTPPSGSSSQAWSCTACFLVSSAPFTTTKIEPAAAGQGATDVPITITGTNFAKGMTVSIAASNVTVRDVTFVDTTKLTALVDVADNADLGKGVVVTVTAGDGSKTTNLRFDVNPKPGVKTVAPSALGQGAGSAASTVTLTITAAQGTLQSGVKLDLGPDITTVTKTVTPGTAPIGVCPVCTGGSDDQMTADVVIAQTAASVKRDVVLVNPDHGRGVLAQGFTVNPGPKVTSVANEKGQPFLTPDNVKHTVSFFGAGFSVTDPKTAFALTKLDGTADPALKVENVVVEAGKITADITVQSTAALSARRITLSNASDKGYGTCDTCVAVANVPGAPVSLHLVPGGGSLTAAWGAPDSHGSPITSYHLTIQRVGSSTATRADVDGATLTKTFTGLTNGVTYTVRVQAVNGVGAGPAASATGIAGVATALTSVPSATKLTAGSPVRFSGKLVAGTAPVSGKTVALRFTPAVGTAVTRYVTTNVAGSWSYVTVAKYTFTLRAAFAGDATYRSSAAPTRLVYVAARVLRTSPTNGTTSSASTALRIAGNVYPNKAGATVYLFRYVNGTRTLMGRALVTTASNFAFIIQPPRGKYTMKIYIGASRGNLANYSAPFTLYRS